MNPSLTVETISVAYGPRRILDDVSIAPCAPGASIALIGPNAAGKSTLLKAIAGLVPVQRGSIRLGDTRLTAMKSEARARLVRFVPQAYATSARLTVFEILLVARMCGVGGRPTREDLAAVGKALARCALEHLSDRCVAELSGGQQQLVALAQALTRPAPVLLLDEPTSALDIRNQLEAFAILKRVAAEDGAIVIAAVHDLNLAARHADRVLLLGAGRLIADGPPDALLVSDACAQVYGVGLASGRTSRGSLALEAYLPTA
ncbi:hypothetical protein VZ95_06395 [Elstera litoralis]|uniref:ABC transporter domain-containing protein n=1 Tax=Elstera litoralis TaxID=552518 RepID=A0A0F3IXA5_9PROT|nr:ABC transporter ATP-binding protein [Elstera litoralis]KJV10224.1 hypothetical protein VZ95_06395 [Elstera litoralis]